MVKLDVSKHQWPHLLNCSYHLISIIDLLYKQQIIKL